MLAYKIEYDLIKAVQNCSDFYQFDSTMDHLVKQLHLSEKEKSNFLINFEAAIMQRVKVN